MSGTSSLHHYPPRNGRSGIRSEQNYDGHCGDQTLHSSGFRNLLAANPVALRRNCSPTCQFIQGVGSVSEGTRCSVTTGKGRRFLTPERLVVQLHPSPRLPQSADQGAGRPPPYFPIPFPHLSPVNTPAVRWNTGPGVRGFFGSGARPPPALPRPPPPTPADLPPPPRRAGWWRRGGLGAVVPLEAVGGKPAHRSKAGRTFRRGTPRDCRLARPYPAVFRNPCPFPFAARFSHNLDAIMGRSAVPVNGAGPLHSPPSLRSVGSRVGRSPAVTGPFIPPGLSMPAS